MGYILFIVIAIVAIILINHQIKQTRRRKGEEVIKEIQRLYWHLNDIVIPIYNFKNCPQCGKNLMNIGRISSSGKSIKCVCENCREMIKSPIKEGKDPTEALAVQNTIKQKLELINSLIGDDVFKKDIDVSFLVNSP